MAALTRRRCSMPALLLLLIICSSLLCDCCCAGGHVYTDSFPDWDDYDASILDPNTANGAPLGGFSRATRSRLAALPLQLPVDLISSPTSQQDENEENTQDTSDSSGSSATSAQGEQQQQQQHPSPQYMHVKDAQGRSFACRVYHEDELDPESLNDSMFDAPKLRTAVEVASKATKSNMDVEAKSDDDAAADTTSQEEDNGPKIGDGSPEKDDTEQNLGSSEQAESRQEDGETTGSSYSDDEEADDGDDDENTDDDSSSSSSGGGGNNNMQKAHLKIMKALQQSQNVVEASRRLAQLKGICGQLHKGWWSYEWCYESTLSQFHLQLDKKQEQMSIESISSLGEFDKRQILVNVANQEPNPAAAGQEEIARIVDSHTNGALCDETGERRKSYVTLQCCNPKVMEKTRGLLHKNQKRIQSHIAAVMQIVEKPVCTYNVTVCTPLLCRDLPNAVETATKSTSEGSATTATSRDLATGGTGPGSTEGQPAGSSVREILNYALGQYCIESDTGGWWTYKFCHGQDILQYHEAIGTSRSDTGSVVMTRSIETEHVLGVYNPETANAHPGEDWRFVVNATAGSSKSSSSSIGGGNGAYFELEYVGGDVCDHSDVTDAAIIAGGSAGSGGVERASSVRYYCGDAYSIQVNEDSTCHYVVHVTVPNLCKHPLFLAPVSKRQFFKCLPVDDDDE